MPFYLATLGGNVFEYGIAAALAEVFAFIVCVTIVRKVSLKACIIFYCGISAISALLLIFYGEGTGAIISFLILFANFGIMSAFDIAYLINLELFPTIFLATAYGCCNVLGRLISILSP
jgi:hypothetical protein